MSVVEAGLVPRPEPSSVGGESSLGRRPLNVSPYRGQLKKLSVKEANRSLTLFRLCEKKEKKNPYHKKGPKKKYTPQKMITMVWTKTRLINNRETSSSHLQT